MSKEAVNDLINQYQRAIGILYSEIERFNDSQWITGLDDFLVPVKIAYHIIDCLDYYFSGKVPEDYLWGYRFGGGWWELPEDRQPDKAAVSAYLHEVEARIIDELNSLMDEDLLRPFTLDECARSVLGHYIYALRHTMHHHGELAAVSVFHKNAGGDWM